MTQLTIVFDLDGTLVDTAPDLIGTLNLLFASIDVPPVEAAEARGMIGNGVRPLIERGLAAKGQILGPEEIDALYVTYLEHYAAHIADQSQPFPGVVEALDRLAGNGATLAVCTNKLEWLSVKLLNELDLAKRFATICGQDTFSVKKPDPDMLRQTIARAGGHVARSVMVGDSATDIDTARGARVPVIAVDFGYTTVPVTQLGPDRIISHFVDLPGAVADLMVR